VFLLLFWFCGDTSYVFFAALLCILTKQAQMLGRFADDFGGCISSKKFQKSHFCTEILPCQRTSHLQILPLASVSRIIVNDTLLPAPREFLPLFFPPNPAA